MSPEYKLFIKVDTSIERVQLIRNAIALIPEVKSIDMMESIGISTKPEIILRHAEGSTEELENSSVSELIRKFRTERAISQRQLAIRAGIAPETLNRIEAAKKIPRATTVVKLANVLFETDSEDPRVKLLFRKTMEAIHNRH